MVDGAGVAAQVDVTEEKGPHRHVNKVNKIFLNNLREPDINNKFPVDNFLTCHRIRTVHDFKVFNQM